MGDLVRTSLKTFTALGRATMRRPLDMGELLAALSLSLVLGTAYCAAYCRIAFYPMHEGGMPVWLSLWWAATCLAPWLLAFEAVKRLAPLVSGRLGRFTGFIAIAGATAALTIAAQRVGDVDMMGMGHAKLSTLVANQMLPILLFAALVGLWLAASRGTASVETDANQNAETLPSLGSIDWIRSAGNYVEVKCGDRLLIRRMTMRSAEEATKTADFVRIHRSIILRKDLIAGFAGSSRSRVALTTGEVLPVGDSYRPSVERLVPSSLGPSLHPINL